MSLPHAFSLITLLLAGCSYVPPKAPQPETARETPSAAGPTTEPEVTPASPQRVEFHLQLSIQEQFAQARGLTFRWPQYGTDLPIEHDRIKIIYEWRPEDGKEKQTNPNTRQKWGPIWKESVVEQLEPDNLQRHLDTMEKWINTYIPESFDGIVCVDLEQWPLKGDEFHLHGEQKATFDRMATARGVAAPSQAELMAQFMRATEARAKQLRPRVKGWGWWAMGSMHPQFPFWYPKQYAAWKAGPINAERRAIDEAWDGKNIPMPSFYFFSGFDNPAERNIAWQRLKENWIAMYGAERLARDGYAYLNVTHAHGPKNGKILTREEFKECVDQAWSLGIRKFILWDAVQSVSRRDAIQKFIDEIVVPEVRDMVVRNREQR